MLNRQSGNFVVVGSIEDGSVLINSQAPAIVFLGDATEPPVDEKASIDVTF
jgi:hypothetical protein